MTDPDLERELTALGERLDVPPALDEARLMNGVRRSLASPESSRWSRLWPARLRTRRLAIAVVAFVACGAALAAAPYVLRFAGIEFRPVEKPTPTMSASPSVSASPSPSTTTAKPTPTLPGSKGTSLEDARARARFVLVVPKKLGEPERVELADGDPPRVVSLLWKGIRLDEFDGTLGPYYFKKVGGDAEYVQVGGDDGIWVNAPHEVVYTDRNGVDRSESARMSEKTLIWQHGKTTLRLEGDFTKAEALAIATS